MVVRVESEAGYGSGGIVDSWASAVRGSGEIGDLGKDESIKNQNQKTFEYPM